MSIRRTAAILGAGLTVAAVVAAAGTALAGTALAGTAAGPTTTILSVTTAGVPGTGHSMLPGVSRTGRYVTFRSTSTNLVPRKPSDPPPARDVFLWDRDTGKLEVISVDTGGTRLPGHSGYGASPVTSNGRYVLFSSLVTKPTPADPKHQVFDVFLRTRLGANSTTVDLTPSADGFSAADAISDNGRFLTYTSEATNLVRGDTNKASDVFLLDRKTGKTTRISVSVTRRQGDGASAESAMDASGRYITFASRATNLVPGDTNGHTDVFLYDRVNKTIERISVTSAGQQFPDESERPAISGDGRYVAFASFSAGASVQVYLRDRVAGTTTLISHATNGPVGNSVSTDPSVSGNGRYVAFRSIATNLVPGVTHAAIYVYDTTTRKLSVASVNNAGVPATGAFFGASVGDTGVAFQALTRGLGGPPSGTYQVYYRSF
jgi:Tol biopolymer transport system component